jgi:hypothetical protein
MWLSHKRLRIWHLLAAVVYGGLLAGELVWISLSRKDGAILCSAHITKQR